MYFHAMWMWILAHWKFWEWPEHIVKFFKSWFEMLEAKHKATRAEAETNDIKRDIRIKEIVREIFDHESELQTTGQIHGPASLIPNSYWFNHFPNDGRTNVSAALREVARQRSRLRGDGGRWRGR